MAYQNGFVVSIIHNGKPLREMNESGQRVVKIPFGSEYVIRVKNNHQSERAMVELDVDGTDILFGKRIIVPANRSVDIERFVDSHSTGKKLKFVSIEEGARTGEIQDPTSPNNGLIKVKFFKEIKKPSILRSTKDVSPFLDTWYSRNANDVRGDISITFATNIGGTASEAYHSQTFNSVQKEQNSMFCSASLNGLDGFPATTCCAQGATVEGGNSNQAFQESSGFDVDPYPTQICIWLRGNTNIAGKAVWEFVFESGCFYLIVNGTKNRVQHQTFHGTSFTCQLESGATISGDAYKIRT